METPGRGDGIHFQGDARGRAAVVRADSQLVSRDQDAVPTERGWEPGGVQGRKVIENVIIGGVCLQRVS